MDRLLYTAMKTRWYVVANACCRRRVGMSSICRACGELIDNAFGRKLLPDYFERTKLLRAYVSENYRAAVILTDDGGRPLSRQVRGAG